MLAPLDFKDSQDQGTLAVRYVVQRKDDSKTIVHIDAVFVEDFLHTVHASNGSVENAESQDIQDRVDAMEAEKKQAGEREKQRQEQLAKQMDERKQEADEASALAAAQTSAQTLDQRVNDLRHQAERVVKAPGGSLKSAPFQSAKNVKTLEAGAEVVILVVTPLLVWCGNHRWATRLDEPPRTGAAAMRRKSLGGISALKLFLIFCPILTLAFAHSSAAQSIPYERAFPQSRTIVEKRIKELQSSAGRLPVLDGFTVPAISL